MLSQLSYVPVCSAHREYYNTIVQILPQVKSSSFTVDYVPVPASFLYRVECLVGAVEDFLIGQA